MPPPAFGADSAVPIRPSKWLCVWIALVTIAAVALCAVYLPVWAALIAGLFAVGIAIYVTHRDALLTLPHSIVALRFGQSGLHYQSRNGVWREAQGSDDLASSFVSRWLSIVAVSAANTVHRRHIVLMPDSLDHDVARQIRVWLKWSRNERGDGANQ
jgi:hypothetical protein